MAIQTTSLDSTIGRLEQRATEYDTRANTEQRVNQARENLKKLNTALDKLKSSFKDFERQRGILTEVFEQTSPPEASSAQDEARSIADFSQDDVLDIIEDGNRSLSKHVDRVRETRETVEDAQRAVNDRLKTLQREKLAAASTAESIQKLVGEDPDAMDTLSDYRLFVNSVLNPKDSVSNLKSEWQGLEKAFQNLDTDWEGFRQRHGLSQQTVEDLKKLSHEDEVDLDELSDTSVTEMLNVPDLRSTIKVSL